MPSPSSLAISGLLRVIGALRPLTPVKTLQDAVDRKTAKPADPTPKWIGKDVTVSETTIQGMRCFTLTPSNPSGAHVLYLHGGSYTFEISPIQYWGVAKLVRGAQVTVTVPIYPLAPSSTADKTVSWVTGLAVDLLQTHPRLMVMGDSAGGGMALAVGQALVAMGKAPSRLVLISPWLDVTMTNPELDGLVRRDPMLNRQDITDAGRLYAGPLDVADPVASPINGELAGLPPITMFCGTHDMLLADAHALVTRGRAAGVQIDYYEQPGGQHVYPMLPTREGRAARTQLIDVLSAQPRAAGAS